MLTPLNKNTLYIVSTPIGNLKDITIRGLEVLSQVDLLLVEDTRSIQFLLKTYKISPNRIISYHSHNERARIEEVLKALQSQSVALVSEAGTPLICDPGILLIKEVIKNKIPIVSIPGVSAFTTLLPITGFPLSDFYFAGFLSSKISKKKNQLLLLKELKTLLIIYESVHRIKETVGFLKDIFPSENEMVIGRELTKEFETIYRGTLQEINTIVFATDFVCKGEFCIIINNR